MKDDQFFPATIILLPFLLLAACTAPKGVYHTVLPGQTLYSISRAYNVNDRYLARLNNIDDPVRLRVGRQLFIPGAARKVEVAATKPAIISGGKAPAETATAAKSPVPPQARATGVPKTKAGSTAVKGIFTWPLKGDLLQTFGQSGNRNCNGVEIAAPEKTPIQAAAAGQVIYSGDGIRGYGNLIIIRHDDSFFTVYGFNRKNLVASGASVKRGEQIALSGSPPSGGAPRLHFEIRHGKAPVNPILYLP